MFDAPDVDLTTKAGLEELAVFRSAVEERIQMLPPGTEGLGQISVDPLLLPVQRTPWPMTPRGDMWNPDDPPDGDLVFAGSRLPSDDTVRYGEVHVNSSV